MKQKRLNRKGFTLAETLLAALILLLVSLLLTTGVPTAISAIKRVMLASNAQVLLSTAVDALKDEVGTAWDVENVGTTDNNNEITYYSGDTGAKSSLFYLDSDAVTGEENGIAENGIYVQEYSRAYAFDNAYLGTALPPAESKKAKRMLVSSKASADELYVKFGGIHYYENTGIVTIKELGVYKKEDNSPVPTLWPSTNTMTLNIQVLSRKAGEVTVSNDA